MWPRGSDWPAPYRALSNTLTLTLPKTRCRMPLSICIKYPLSPPPNAHRIRQVRTPGDGPDKEGGFVPRPPSDPKPYKRSQLTPHPGDITPRGGDFPDPFSGARAGAQAALSSPQGAERAAGAGAGPTTVSSGTGAPPALPCPALPLPLPLPFSHTLPSRFVSPPPAPLPPHRPIPSPHIIHRLPQPHADPSCRPRSRRRQPSRTGASVMLTGPDLAPCRAHYLAPTSPRSAPYFAPT